MRVYSAPALLALIISFVTLQASGQSGFSGSDFSKDFRPSDTVFRKAYVDRDEWREKPVRHRYVHGGFSGTETRFSFYFPPEKQYQGRFYQYITPTPDNETLSQEAATAESDKIGFAIESGAYFIETNGGGTSAMMSDPSITSFRANAATAEFSRVLARAIYGTGRPYGYAFGGSGGSLRTIGSIENTDGVWDGVVPYVMPTTMSLPNAMTSTLLAQRILSDKLAAINDVHEVGSNKTIDDVLTTTEQRSAYHELSHMGFPKGAWTEMGYGDIGAFAVIFPIIKMIDPGYFNDFWTKPGYEGYDQASSVKAAQVQMNTKILKLITADEAAARGLKYELFNGETRGLAANSWKSIMQQQGDEKLPVAVEVEQVPIAKTNAYDLIVHSGQAAGKELRIQRMENKVIILMAGDVEQKKMLRVGDELTLDNTKFLAAQYYHRHQMPGDDFDGWKQYRDKDGKTPYAQRPMLLGPLLVGATAGSQLTGKFKGKMIILQNMYDGGAYPWNAHWYRKRVEANMGDKADDHIRVWINDHANHGDYPYQLDPTNTVVYLGILQQALRDLSAWVEKGIDPPKSTSYVVSETQLIVPGEAKNRNGIQPVVQVKANGNIRAEINAGRTVKLEATIEVPANAGKVVSAEWNFGDQGKEFSQVPDLKKHYVDPTGKTVRVSITHTYKQPGIYFVTVRAASQREGNVTTPFTRIQNLGKARVVVK